ncbi:MAG: DNA primase [Patescibacteria group bacterium]|nr:DNA primase [Patescibacteria group bacterium]
MNHSEEIKNKLDIVDVIGEYLNLKSAGSNFRGLCPFHNEKTPSFMVSPDKQIWHCFGCGKGGDILSFIMEIEGLSFIETLKLLAPRAGVVLDNKDLVDNSVKSKLLKILDLSSKYYNFILNSDKGNQKRNSEIREYLKNRGLSDSAIDYWQIGYSPDSYDDLIKFLKSKKFSDLDIQLAGMSFKSEKGAYLNRFRNRIMFPINDINGQVIAFTARINPNVVDDKVSGKYINSPQTEVYDKSRVLFALDKAKMAVKEKDEIILVEGQMDAISVFEAGFKNVSAVSGTALTTYQLNLIKRYTKNIILAFDSDSAGENATDRGISEALKMGFNLKIVSLKDGQDPDDIVRNNPDDFKLALDQAQNIMDYYFDRELLNININDISQKNKAVSQILSIIVKLYNKVEQDFWLKELSQRAKVDEIFLREELQKISKNIDKISINAYSKKEEKDLSAGVVSTWEDKLLESLMSLVLKFNDYGEYVFNNLGVDFISGKYQEFYNSWLIYYNKNKKIDYSGLLEYLTDNKPEFLDLLKKIALISDFYWPDDLITHEQAKGEIIKNLLEIKKNYFKRLINEDNDKLILAEKNGQEVGPIMERLKNWNEELKKIISE